MKLQILVPQYKETDEIVKTLLDSIAIQQRIDFNDVGVIICNDGSDVQLSNRLRNAYDFKIEYYRCPHLGVSATRNACLMYANADYVMFCDADDSFYTNNALYTIFSAIDAIPNDKPDGIISSFVEEIKTENNEYCYILHNDDRVFVHGKVYRKDYLKENSIYFNPELTIHEDSYFNLLARSMSEKFLPITQPIYIWRWRDDSVCRHDPDYILKTYNDLLDSNTALVNKLCELKKVKEAVEYTTRMIFDTYFQLNKKTWLKNSTAEYRESVEKRFARYYAEHAPLFDLANEQMRNQMIMGIKNRMYGEGLFLESITFSEWIKHIEAIAKNENV